MVLCWSLFLALVLASASMYMRQLSDQIVIRSAVAADVPAMAELQRRVFPTLCPTQLLSEEHFAAHIDIFPAGQIVVMFNDRLIGSTSTFRCPYPPAHHTFVSITGDLWLTTHDPEGAWLYGFDMGIEPKLQGFGLGRYLYRARSELTRQLGMAGQVIVGMPSGYGKVSGTVPFDLYYEKILSGEVFDPTVSMQMRMGFEPSCVVADYLIDPKCGNYGVMMNLDAAKTVADPKLGLAELTERIHQTFSPAPLSERVELATSSPASHSTSSADAGTPSVGVFLKA